MQPFSCNTPGQEPTKRITPQATIRGTRENPKRANSFYRVSGYRFRQAARRKSGRILNFERDIEIYRRRRLENVIYGRAL